MDLKNLVISFATFIYGYVQVSAQYWKSIGKLAVDESVLVHFKYRCLLIKTFSYIAWMMLQIATQNICGFGYFFDE